MKFQIPVMLGVLFLAPQAFAQSAPAPDAPITLSDCQLEVSEPVPGVVKVRSGCSGERTASPDHYFYMTKEAASRAKQSQAKGGDVQGFLLTRGMDFGRDGLRLASRDETETRKYDGVWFGKRTFHNPKAPLDKALPDTGLRTPAWLKLSAPSSTLPKWTQAAPTDVKTDVKDDGDNKKPEGSSQP